MANEADEVARTAGGLISTASGSPPTTAALATPGALTPWRLAETTRKRCALPGEISAGAPTTNLLLVVRELSVRQLVVPACCVCTSKRSGPSQSSTPAFAAGSAKVMLTSQLLSPVAMIGAGGLCGARVGAGVEAIKRSLHPLRPSGLTARTSAPYVVPASSAGFV